MFLITFIMFSITEIQKKIVTALMNNRKTAIIIVIFGNQKQKLGGG